MADLATALFQTHQRLSVALKVNTLSVARSSGICRPPAPAQPAASLSPSPEFPYCLCSVPQTHQAPLLHRAFAHTLPTSWNLLLLQGPVLQPAVLLLIIWCFSSTVLSSQGHPHRGLANLFSKGPDLKCFCLCVKKSLPQRCHCVA